MCRGGWEKKPNCTLFFRVHETNIKFYYKFKNCTFSVHMHACTRAHSRLNIGHMHFVVCIVVEFGGGFVL